MEAHLRPRGVSSLFNARVFSFFFCLTSISDYRALSSPHVVYVELPKIAGLVLMRELKYAPGALSRFQIRRGDAKEAEGSRLR